MKKRRRSVWFVLGCVLCFVVAGCAIADEPSVTAERLNPPIAITPIVLTLTFEGTCEDNMTDFELWVGTALSVHERLIGMWDATEAQDDGALLGTIERLVMMRNGVGSLRAPDCTAQAHALLVTIIDTTLQNFQMFYNRELTDLEVARLETNERLNQLGMLLESLLDTLQALSGIE